MGPLMVKDYLTKPFVELIQLPGFSLEELVFVATFYKASPKPLMDAVIETQNEQGVKNG